jgi:K+-sensing histidine kinase KdpD
MIPIKKPENEEARLNSLRGLHILDTLPEQQYDNITELASYICGTRNAVISLVDENRQWFKSKVGIAACETSREVSFCAHAIHNPKELLEISDASTDLRFKDNPLVHDKENPVIFYAGMPILDKSGHALGTLCVMDNHPKTLDEKQKKALKNLAQQVQELLKLHVVNNELQESRGHLKKHNELLKDFAGTISHDMKMPLANLIVTSDILKKKYSELFDDNGKKYLNYLKKSSLSLSNYITDILAHYESSSYNMDERKSFDVNDLLENIIELINIKHDCEINLPEFNHTIHCNRVALEQIFLNLIGNSIK